MVKKILATTGSRVLTGFILLAVLFLHTRYLGAEILGDITLLKLALTINNLVVAIFCGPALVYLCNRYSPSRVLLPAILWILFTAFIGSSMQYYFDTFPSQLLGWLIILSLLFGLQILFENLLLSAERILAYNTSAVLHHVLLVSATWFFLFYQPTLSVYNFVYAMALALSLNVLYLLTRVISLIKVKDVVWESKIWVEIFKDGALVQLTNFLQTLNYRVSVYFLNAFWGKHSVGYFGAALQLAEAVWIIGKSLAVVQYARLSAVTDQLYQIRFTLAFSKLSFTLSGLAMITLLLIPEPVYVQLLGTDWLGIKHHLWLLLPGILMFSLVLSYSHYFSALGKFHINTLASGLALLLISILGYIFIPVYGLDAAALIYSGGLILLALYYLIVLLVFKHASISYIIPNRGDIQYIKSVLKGS